MQASRVDGNKCIIAQTKKHREKTVNKNEWLNWMMIVYLGVKIGWAVSVACDREE